MATLASIVMDGTEKTLVQTTSGTPDYQLFLDADLNPLGSGDTLVVRVYVAVDGTNYRLVDTLTFTAPPAVPIQTIVDGVWMAGNMPGKVTLQQTAGTNRTFNYAYRARF